MQEAVSARTPAHLWIVSILSLIWSCFGAYDYVMTRMQNVDYLKSSMPGVDPQVAIDWINGMPLFAQFGWGLGVWSGLLGAALLLVRSRLAMWAFAASMLGIVLGIGYQLVAAPPLPGASGAMYQVMPYLIIVIGVALLAYSQAMARKGVLR